jgi:hypothetical protein
VLNVDNFHFWDDFCYFYTSDKFMKIKLTILALILYGTSFSQEFGSQFLTINESTLPQVFAVENSFFIHKYDKVTFTHTLGVTASNYWKAVSMEEALNRQEAYLNRRNTTTRPITAETLGFRRVVEKERTIWVEVRDPYFARRNGVRNQVYRDASMPFMYSPYFPRFVPGTEF